MPSTARSTWGWEMLPQWMPVPCTAVATEPSTLGRMLLPELSSA